MSDNKYFGNCKAVTFNVNGEKRSKLRVGLNRDHLNEMLSLCNERGWLNLDIIKRQQPSQYGDTHSIKHDNWQPDTTQARQGMSSSPQVEHQDLGQPNASAKDIGLDDFEDSIPF